MSVRTMFRVGSFLGALASLGLVGCGGSGDSSTGDAFVPVGPIGPVGGGQSTGNSYVAGTYMPSSQFKGMCATPRTGNSQDRLGKTLDEQLWLRSWTNELYLWYREVPDIDPAPYTVASYFPLLKSSGLTPGGNPKDKPGFHFTYPTTVWEELSQGGVSVGYGVEFESVKRTTPRELRVAFIEPLAPGTTTIANLSRGAKILTVDGADFVNANDQTSIDKINAGLSPSVEGSQHSFSVLDPGASTPRNVTLQAVKITSTPVQNTKVITSGGVKFGYLQFNEHIATAESQLITAINILKAGQITELVLDLRYNGGGSLGIASELAYMIAGATPTLGQTFEKIVFNDKYSTLNPVTGAANTPTPFYNTSNAGQALPTLGFSQVFVLTGAGTCSASESIINGLMGIGIKVVQVGSTTCGKPFGFYPQDNCGTTYFSIELKGVNAKGFGEYSDGFSPKNTVVGKGAEVDGCSVADDFTHALGDQAEGRLAAALAFRANGTCPVASGFASDTLLKPGQPVDTVPSDGLVLKSPLRENRWY